MHAKRAGPFRIHFHCSMRRRESRLLKSVGQARKAPRRGSYLARHRINANSRVILHQQGSGAAEWIKFAREDGADIIVIGAYGHSRLGEWIFGGVTRDLLGTSSICCLMSH
jgi:nucleotide-binding universal stress UspA family protein